MKIMSIDPAGNGVTAIVVADYDYMADEPIIIKDFAQFDFRADGETNSEYIKEIRYIQACEVIEYIKEIQPSLIILENYIVFRNQVSPKGKSLPTSELIGIIDYECRKMKIPVIKPRSSDIYEWDGYGKRKIKYSLNNETLKSRNILISGARGALSINVNGDIYRLIDYQIGSKNDHLIMCIRHLINEIENKTPDCFEKAKRIVRQRYEKDYTNM